MYNERIIPLIEGADLLYHEATFANDNEAWASRTFHSTARQAARIAAKAGVKSLLLGHFSARYDKNEEILLQQAREEYANVQLARENMQIVIKNNNPRNTCPQQPFYNLCKHCIGYLCNALH